MLLINFCLYWCDCGLLLLFIEGFLLMGVFVILFNYIGYWLMMLLWLLSQVVVGLLLVVYFIGIWSLLKVGVMIVCFGCGLVMFGFIVVMFCGLLLMFFFFLWFIFIGMLLFFVGFFVVYFVVSSWIGLCVCCVCGQVLLLYLFSYYLGLSFVGMLGGVFWYYYGWNGVGGFIVLLFFVVLLIGICLYQ